MLTKSDDKIVHQDKKTLIEKYLDKFKMETLTKEEAEMLKSLLIEKQDELLKKDDEIAAIGLAFLIIGLMKYISLK